MRNHKNVRRIFFKLNLIFISPLLRKSTFEYELWKLDTTYANFSRALKYLTLALLFGRIED